MAVTSYRFPGTVISWDHDSDGGVAWTNPGNAAADDNTDATKGYTTATPSTPELLRATNFGFTTSDIPTSSSIVGIELVQEAWLVAGTVTVRDTVAQMIIANAAAGTNQGASANTLTGTRTAYTYGGPTSLLGTTITDTQARDSQTGWMVQWEALALGMGAQTGGVDYMKMRYYYSTGGGGGPVIKKKPVFIMRTAGLSLKAHDNYFEDYMESMLELRGY